jgi:hypothetical protein
MIALRLALLSLLALLGPLDDDDGNAPAPGARQRLSSLHLGSFSSMLAGRIGADGALDSGAGVLRLLDEAGRPLELRSLAYAKGPSLWVRFKTTLGEVELTGRALGISRSGGGDARIACMLQLTLSNSTPQEQQVGFSASLSAGGGDPLARPLPALPFTAGTRFARVGQLITRDGAALLQWTGKPPEVRLADAVSGPDDVAAELDWNFTLAPRSTRYLDLMLIGPPAGEELDEDAIRSVIEGTSFETAAELLDWQSMYRGRFANFEGNDSHMRDTMVTSVHCLRMLGVALDGVGAITEKPFGHPGLDAALKAEALGMFAEWGLAEWAAPEIKGMIHQVDELCADLSAERRLVLIHGLVRAARISDNEVMPRQLATAIREWLTEPTTVRPWLDPAEVTADLQDMFRRAALFGDDAEFELPELSWSPEPVGVNAVRMLSMRRALSDGRGRDAWEIYQQILDSTDVRGFGSLAANGEMDGRFGLGFMALTRAMLVDDRGDDVRMFANVVPEMIPHPGQLHLPLIATRFGAIDATLFWVGAKKTKLAAQIYERGMLIPGRILLEMPVGLTARAVQGEFGGHAKLLIDGSVECIPDRAFARGVRFNIPVRKD